MRDIIAGAGFLLMIFSTGLFDNEDLTVPCIVMGISFVLMGIAWLIEWKEGMHGKKLHRGHERTGRKERFR